MSPDPGEVTRLLQRAEEGDEQAKRDLYARVEEDLRRIARRRRREVGGGPGLDDSTTGLIDEAFVRLVGQDLTTWHPGDRHKFFGYISTVIHDFLIDELRKRKAKKRGGDRVRVEFDADMPEATPKPIDHIDLLIDLKEKLLRFAEFAPDAAALFRIRFFLGCTTKETGERMGLSEDEVKTMYAHAQLWLRRELKGYNLDT